nr:L-lactate permease [Bacillota bacterium]
MWEQVYTPVGGQLAASAACALVPVGAFVYLLAVRRVRGYRAALIALALAILLAVGVWRMPPAMALAAAGYGVAYGLWPIGGVVLAAVFLYKLAETSGLVAVIRASIGQITADRRLQVLLIAYGFGGFLEGVAGFGTPEAITAALLVGLGFRPLLAAGLCLVANTAPVAWATVGIPIVVAAQMTGLDASSISRAAALLVMPLSLIIPFLLVAIVDGWRGVRETWPAAAAAGGTFALVQVVLASKGLYELPSVLAPLASMAALVGFVRVVQRRGRTARAGAAASVRWLAADEVAAAAAQRGGPSLWPRGAEMGEGRPESIPAGQVLRAWSPFLLLIAVVGVWNVPAVKELLDRAAIVVPVPALHERVWVMPPAASVPMPLPAVYVFNGLGAAATAVFLAALAAKPLFCLSWRAYLTVGGQTLRELGRSLVTISLLLGVAYLARYAGLSATLGVFLAKTGSLFPLVSPVLGWLGVMATGSNTSSNVLFAPLQHVVAQRVGVDSALLVAANAAGGAVGKMVSPQSLAIVCAVTNLVGKEAKLFRFALKYSLGLLALVCGLAIGYA